ncbi:MAG: DUF1428 domain-containing protein [Gammaproteobacteria bacterium]|nr:DUF1428 domain-containing protein [Gammaproteobacteria bacterium]
MSYVDGYVIPVPIDKKQQYIEQASLIATIFKQAGALEVVENWADDVPAGELTSFIKAVQCTEDEQVVFSWVVWPSKDLRDKGWEVLMNDPRMDPKTNPMPFDGKRLIYGGFTTVVRA